MGAANEIARFCNEGNLKETNAHNVAIEIERQVNRNSLGYNMKDFEEREQAIRNLEQKQPLEVANVEDIKRDTEGSFRPEMEGPDGGFDFSQIPTIPTFEPQANDLGENFEINEFGEIIRPNNDGNKVTLIDDEEIDDGQDR